MRTFAILVSAAVLCGCTVTKISSGSWSMERKSFLQRMDIGEVTIATNGTARLSGYKSDGGNEALGVAVGAAVAAAINSAK